MANTASWAVLSQGVATSRVEAHRLQALLSRALQLVRDSDEKEALYEAAGDLIQGVPARLDALLRSLDQTFLAVSQMSADEVNGHLSLSDRKEVEQAMEPAGRMAQRVASQWVQRQADLSPPLGFPGGPCHTIERIQDEVRNPVLREELIDELERGRDLSNADATKIWQPLKESLKPNKIWDSLVITAHAQYRMDLRGVTVGDVKVSLANLYKVWMDYRSQKHPQARLWEEAVSMGREIEWFDPKLDLFLVFKRAGLSMVLITCYWPGMPNPPAPGEGGCS